MVRPQGLAGVEVPGPAAPGKSALVADEAGNLLRGGRQAVDHPAQGLHHGTHNPMASHGHVKKPPPGNAGKEADRNSHSPLPTTETDSKSFTSDARSQLGRSDSMGEISWWTFLYSEPKSNDACRNLQDETHGLMQLPFGP